ncbi:phage tail domain-containing protein [Anaerostipes faecalis]|uniref:phage tail domain-containing protein n=1 Tax=Anaerostipes faecalis TaxID=2738446 RepID=UPI003F001A6D
MYSNSIGFSFNGKSLSDFSPNIIIGHIDKSDDSFGLKREIVNGTTTMNRNIYHAYNTKYSEQLSFSVTLLHVDQSRFTFSQISELTRWLTSPKSYRKIQFYDCEGTFEDIFYYAIVTNVSPNESLGIAGITIEFTCNSSYGFIEKTTGILDTIDTLEVSNYTLKKKIYCDSDELEEYVYPIIIINADYLWSNLQIINHTDNERIMDLYDIKGNYKINCQHQVIVKNNSYVMLSDLFKIDKLEKLYWLRLLPGENDIEIIGRGLIEIKWLEPKKVGAF